MAAMRLCRRVADGVEFAYNPMLLKEPGFIVVTRNVSQNGGTRPMASDAAPDEAPLSSIEQEFVDRSDTQVIDYLETQFDIGVEPGTDRRAMLALIEQLRETRGERMPDAIAEELPADEEPAPAVDDESEFAGLSLDQLRDIAVQRFGAELPKSVKKVETAVAMLEKLKNEK